MLAGVSRDSVVGTVELAEFAANAGYDMVLVRQPSVFRDGAGARELLTYFRSVADRSPVPVVLYSPDGLLPVEVAIELAGHPQIIGLVDGGHGRIGVVRAGTDAVRREVTVTTVFAAATGRMLAQREATGAATYIAADALTGGGAGLAVAPPKPAIKTRTKTVGFQVVAAGAASASVDLLEAGVQGVLPELAACAPQGCHEVWAAFKDGDPQLARLKAERLLEADAVVSELGVAGVKYACDLNGYFGGAPRLPRVGLTAEEKARVEKAFREVRN